MVKKIITAALLALIPFSMWWFSIPININSTSFWLWLICSLIYIIVIATMWFWFMGHTTNYLYDHLAYPEQFKDKEFKIASTLFKFRFVPVIAFAVLRIIGTPIIMAESYATLLNPKEAAFSDFADKLLIENISLMDTDSATLVGSRELGKLADVVSQFDDDEYYQIIVNGTPQKVSPLQYVGLFSWINNRETGTPGYVSVDPIKQNADYYELASIKGTGDGMRFVPSAYLAENLRRHVWLHNITSVLGKSHFELDEEGHPYYVTQVMGFKTPMGAQYVEAVIVTDPTDGSMTRYDTDEVPSWLDVVYDGDLLDKMYDYYGGYSKGFLNSIFGQIGCTRTGGDYGYVNIDGEQWIYTGITSMGSDASNIGFLLASEKTGEAYFLPMSSADEESAMRSAEGKVQQFGYVASFPSLVSIDGQPTYVMVLKDAAGLIRLYSFVNAESYNVVACEASLEAARVAYEDAMSAAGISFTKDEQAMPETDAQGAPVSNETPGDQVVIDDSGNEYRHEVSSTNEIVPEGAERFDIAVLKYQFVDVDGNTYAYMLVNENGDEIVYRMAFDKYPKVCLELREGTQISGWAVDNGKLKDVV